MSPADRSRVPDVARVEAELAELWRDASDDGDTVTRACTLNLIVVCADGAQELQAATNLVARVAATEPGRALVVSFPGDGVHRTRDEQADDFEVYVSAHCHLGAGGKQICSEQITLEACGAGRDLIPATVLQLLEGELPVYTLWRRAEFDESEEGTLPQTLLELSDRFIVNSGKRDHPMRALAGMERFASGVSGQGRTADITWERVEPWREALASFFDLPALRSGLERISALRIEGSGPADSGEVTAAGAYLAGWLASRLDWSRDESGLWRRPDGVPLEISFASVPNLPAGELAAARIATELYGSPAVLAARRLDTANDVVQLSVQTETSCPLPWKIKLPARDDAALLCGMLQRSRKDPIFDAALQAASRF